MRFQPHHKTGSNQNWLLLQHWCILQAAELSATLRRPVVTPSTKAPGSMP